MEKSGFSSYQFGRNRGGSSKEEIIVDTFAKKVNNDLSYATLLRSKEILTGDKQINHDNSLAELSALESNRPREEWDLSHVRIEDVSPLNAAKQITHDDEAVDLTNALKGV